MEDFAMGANYLRFPPRETPGYARIVHNAMSILQYGWWPNYLNTVPNFVRQFANARAKTRHRQYAKMCAAPSAPRTFLGSEGVAFLRAHLPIGARNLARCSNNLATNRNINVSRKFRQPQSRGLTV